MFKITKLDVMYDVAKTMQRVFGNVAAIGFFVFDVCKQFMVHAAHEVLKPTLRHPRTSFDIFDFDVLSSSF